MVQTAALSTTVCMMASDSMLCSTHLRTAGPATDCWAQALAQMSQENAAFTFMLSSGNAGLKHVLNWVMMAERNIPSLP